MATNYAEVEEVNVLLAEADPDQEDATENEVLYVERLLDVFAFPNHSTWNTDTNRVLTLGDGSLTGQQEYCLKVAVARQVEYVRRMGRSFFEQSQHSQVSADGFSSTGKLARVAPAADASLQSCGLRVRTGRIGSRTERPANWFETGWDIRAGDR